MSAEVPRRGLERWLREPVIHFLGLGALLFVLSGVFGSTAPGDPTIAVSAAEVSRLAELFAAQWQRPPTPEELDSLVEQQVREEVLYREAVAMGLDQNDAIVRRRLVQKLEFLSLDLANDDPSEADLRTFFDDNTEVFEEPARLTFSHVYLSPDRRGEALDEDARRLLDSLRAGDADPDAAGDTFLLPTNFTQRSRDQLNGLFGEEFASALMNLPMGSWQGPLVSGYGLHLVLVGARVEPEVPEFSTVRDDVRVEYVRRMRDSANEATYRRLRDRYRVDVAWPPEVIDEPAPSDGSR